MVAKNDKYFNTNKNMNVLFFIGLTFCDGMSLEHDVINM